VIGAEQEFALKELIWRRDGVADTRDFVIGVPLIVSILSIVGAIIFIFAPDRHEPAALGVIAAMFIVTAATKAFVDRRKKSAFVKRATDVGVGVGAGEAKEFYESFDWDEADARN
jgi:hypothetical protein